ncbi:MAG TPA: sulfite exporter TauE/SafE family protein [Stenomitos sp.]
MSYAIVPLVALAASLLTFYSGFGLGTLLMPAFALFFPLPVAIAATAIVHLLNNLVKAGLVMRHASRPIVLRFGVPALIASVLGAWLLTWMSGLPPFLSYDLLGRTFAVTPVKLLVGVLLGIFAVLDLLPAFQRWQVPIRWMPLGGVLSGFFGGVSGFQGALRSAFLVKAGLDKEAYIGTGALIAVLVDVSRLALYAWGFAAHPGAGTQVGWPLLALTTGAALTGTIVGNRLLSKVTMHAIQGIVAAMLVLLAGSLALGLV